MRKSLILMAATALFMRAYDQVTESKPSPYSQAPHGVASSSAAEERVSKSTNIIQHMELPDSIAALGQIVVRP